MNAKHVALGLVVMLGAAGVAGAQSVHLTLGKQTSHGAVSLSFSAPLGGYDRPARVWVPGHYEQVESKVWVEGRERRQWVPAAYETRFDECGRPYSVLARQGFWNTVCEPGHFELRSVSLWVDGYWRSEPLACAPRAARPVYGRLPAFGGYYHDGRRR